jgi:CRISPR-associated protein Csx17
VAGLGVDAGIRAFVRYGIVRGRVGGENYNTAISLGRFNATLQPQVDLLREIDPWLTSFRRACSGDTTPPRFSTALRRIDAAIFNFCRYGSKARMAEILCALGNAERELASGEKFRKTDKRTIHPVPLLSAAWLAACDDGSAEFRLALALASIRGSQDGQVGDLRTNLEPVEHKGSRWTWAEQSRAVVWSSADLYRNLIAVLTRRVMDAGRAGLDHLPLGGRFTASLTDVSQFLNGAIHDRWLEELLWGLLLIDASTDWYNLKVQLTKPQDHPLLLPRAYGLLKLLFLPNKLSWPAGTEGIIVKPEPEILGRLRARDADGACQIAARRLRVSGIVPMPGSTSGGPWLDGNLCFHIHAERLAAALLIPIREMTKLAQLVLRPPTETTV